MHSIRKEVRRISNQHYQTTLDLRKSSNERILQRQSRPYTHQHTDYQAAKEDEQEDPNSLEQRENVEISLRATNFVPLRCLKQDNSNGIIQDRLSEDYCVQLRLNFVDVEDGQDRDGICRRERSTDRDSLNETDGQAVQGYSRPYPQNETQRYS